MSIEGMTQKEFDRWRGHILTYLRINPPCPSMICSIDRSKSGCFAHTKNLVRVFQIMIDSGELKYNKEREFFQQSMYMI
jgi:hypothetical protein